MTFLSPVTLPDAIEAEVWRAYVADRARVFFDKHARDDSFDAVCFMLIPKPGSLPVLAVEDEYDDVASLTHQMLHVVDDVEKNGARFAENSCGQIVIAWPLVFADDAQRGVVIDLLRDVGRELRAVATALVSECWMRTDLNAPRGTGTDALVACVEQVNRDVAVSIAEIKGSTPARSLGPWLKMAGTARGGAILGLFNETRAPEINVATVGEA